MDPWMVGILVVIVFILLVRGYLRFLGRAVERAVRRYGHWM